MLGFFIGFLVVAVLIFGAGAIWIAQRLWRLDPLATDREIRVGYARFPDSILLEVAKENGFFDKLPITLREMPWNQVHEALALPQADERLEVAYTNRNAAMIAGGTNFGTNIILDEQDLVLYRGFAVLYWPQEHSMRGVRSFAQLSGMDEVPALSAAISAIGNRTVLASNSTDHAEGISSLIKRYHIKDHSWDVSGTPDELLQKFVHERRDAFYVGGATQRIIAEALGAQVLISQDQIDLGLQSANCFSYLRNEQTLIPTLVNRLNLAWIECAQRMQSDADLRKKYSDKLLALLVSEGQKYGLDASAFKIEALLETIWVNWFITPTAAKSSSVLIDRETLLRQFKVITNQSAAN